MDNIKDIKLIKAIKVKKELGDKMKRYLDGLNIIDLISEKHITLRNEVEKRWALSEEEEISHTEAFLLARLSVDRISLAEVARQAHISRQAMYKCAKKLEERGYLNFVVDEEGNKYTQLTDKGRIYCEKSKALKEEIELEITARLGEEGMQRLKDCLKKEWI